MNYSADTQSSTQTPGPRALYAAFDRFPSSKGAATHINRMAGRLFEKAGGGLLFVLGDKELPVRQKEGPIEIIRYCRAHESFIERAMEYGRRLDRILRTHAGSLRICHFRDPWSGVPVIENSFPSLPAHSGCSESCANSPASLDENSDDRESPAAENRTGKRYVTVYEINGLPSIELPSTFPDLAPRTLEKIRRAEEFCWTHADRIITPSFTLKDNIVALGADPGKITVIPNGADLRPVSPPKPEGAPSRYILYFGAMQRWQGIDVLLKAFARLADLEDLHLVFCASSHSRLAKQYLKLAEKLGVIDRTHWFFRMTESELAPWRAGALLSVAPLTECPRNLEQGCCPLKILESMASGVPVVASDIPSVREIITDGANGRLVRPDRPADLAGAIRMLLEYPHLLEEMGRNAKARIEESFTWERSMEMLDEFYDAACPELNSRQ